MDPYRTPFFMFKGEGEVIKPDTLPPSAQVAFKPLNSFKQKPNVRLPSVHCRRP